MGRSLRSQDCLAGYASVLVSVEFFPFLQLVRGAAIWANRLAGLGDFDVDARMHAPQRSLGARAINRQVGCSNENNVVLRPGGGCSGAQDRKSTRLNSSH